jgi:hypothetical protein
MGDQFVVKRGVCRPVFVFEVGFSIDLEQVARRMGPPAERPVLPHRERLAAPLESRPAPLRVLQSLGGTALPPLLLGPTLELVIYDFGAASVSFQLPLPSHPDDILTLSIAVRRNPALITEARRRISDLIDSLGEAVQRPRVAELVEDYFLFELVEVAGLDSGASFCTDHASWIARVLRAESGELSVEEVRDANLARISFGRGDVTVVDWDSSIILDPDPAHLGAVLEFANVQLLELRYLDDQVDQILERSYQLLSRRTGWRAIALSIPAEERRQLSALQVDSAILLERVTNALKFLGEEYLARVYRLAAARLHLAEWDGVITRKLATVESIYQKLTDRATARRMELLEWVIILLIAFEVFLTLWR